MDTLLVIVTLVSLGVAVALLVLHGRVIREERRRSAARVEALIDASSSAVSDAAGVDVAPASRTRELFLEAAEPVSAFPRLALPASFGVIIVGVILAGLVMWNHGRAKAAPVAGTAVTARLPASIPLELVSLRHERTSDGLSINGLVRNPSSGQRLSDVNVVVFLFAPTGAFVTSVKEPLDFRTLAPGDESPFTISLNGISPIGRYRVSFRTDDTVVPHVDRRQASPAVAEGFGSPTKLEERSRVVAVASTR